ncbi:MAG: hypothetical protein HYX39_11665, partial [Bacteroidetes bacterium]|nr:hypothetical protein [Bacteroidota bacterium]
NIVGNNLVAATTGNIGLGTNSPQYKLHVVGDAYVSNNLFVGGGIIVTDQLKAAEYVTTGRLTADTIKMGLGRVIDGTTKVAGDLYIDPTRTLTAGGDIMANSKLTVAGNATFNGTLKALQGIALDNSGNNTLRLTQSSAPGSFPVISLGGPPGGPSFGDDTNPVSCLKNLNVLPTNGFVGTNNFGLFASSNGLVSSNNNFAFLTAFVDRNNSNGYLDVGGSFDGQSNNNGLYINTKCQRNTYINTTGGITTIGNSIFKKDYAGFTQAVEIGTSTSNQTNPLGLTINGNLGFGLLYNVTANFTKPVIYVQDPTTSVVNFKLSANGKAQFGPDAIGNANAMVHVNVSSTEKPFEIYNTTTAKPVFKIEANGQTVLNTNGLTGTSDVFVVTNDPSNILSTNTNFKIKANGEVYSRYMKVSVNNFPDYVFAKDYKLTPLKEVEAYYKLNNHLSDIPSATEVEKNGLDVAEINKALVKKVEELTIYAVEQNKRADEQEALLIELQKQVEALKKAK